MTVQIFLVWDVQTGGMAELEIPGGQLVSVPDSFANVADRLGMSKRRVQLVGSQETVQVLAPRPMGKLPGEVSNQQISFVEAVKTFAMTPMEPFRLAVGERPVPNDPWSDFPPTVAVPIDAEDLPFSRADMP